MPYHKAETAEAYVKTHPQWNKELMALREILMKTELTETLKWGMPTYTINGKNVIGLSGFKNHFGLWFHQGAFLSDPDKVMINAQAGKTKGMRHMRFESAKDINKARIRKYVAEAIKNQKAGKMIKVASPKTKAVKMPTELKERLEKSKVLTARFQAYTKPRQNAFSEYIASAKRADTKKKRLDQVIPLIKAGEPLSALWR